jgi:hypothetical protein
MLRGVVYYNCESVYYFSIVQGPIPTPVWELNGWLYLYLKS